ncbi:MAG: nicotinamide-nucleotide amidohydrolase family protein [Woeseiaceae bacterium]|nr:nicotinamide-nucleotide amidohydrolase family protein [Woeseiaceae bacterium]
MSEPDSIRELSEKLVHQLVSDRKTVATAESCTGGWIAKSLTDVAGSSACFGYGIVSYSNAAKESLLDVTPDTIAAKGAVSEETVIEMAEGALSVSGADLSVAVSGVAGPDGGTDDKPVGTVWFAFSVRDGSGVDTAAEVERFDGDRDAVRRKTVAHALKGLTARAA